MLLNSMYSGYAGRKTFYLNFIVFFLLKLENSENLGLLLVILRQRMTLSFKKRNLFFNIFNNSVIATKNSLFFKNVKVINFLYFKQIVLYIYSNFYKNFFFTNMLSSSQTSIFYSLKSLFLNKSISTVILKRDNLALSNARYYQKNMLSLFISLKSTPQQHSFLTNNIFNKLNLFSNVRSFYVMYKLFFFLPIYNVIKLNYAVSNQFFKYNVLIQSRLRSSNMFILKYLNILCSSDLNLNISHLKKINILKTRRTGKLIRRLFSSILIRFSESVFKQSICYILDFNPYRSLTNYEWAMLEVFMRRLARDRRNYWKLNTRILQNFVGFKQRLIKRGDAIYWKELISCCFISLKLRDATFLMNYLVKKSNRMPLYKHRFFFSRVFNILKTMFFDLNSYYGIVGIKIQITGKISVTGNSRTRTMIFKQGKTNYSNLGCKCDNSFNIIRTNTGCLGVNIYIFYK